MSFLFLSDLYGQDRIYTYKSTVEFIVNTDTFVQNDDYYKFTSSTISLIQDNANNIENILLIGSASPEGNKNGNIRLANRRASKIYSYISKWVPRKKIIVNNDYNTFLNKTGLDESDYTKLRATYIEIHIKESQKTLPQPDTIYLYKTIRDTIYKDNIITQTDTVYISNKNHDKMIFGVYNSLSGDLLQRPNIGVEFYFHQMSWFLEGSFSDGKIFSKTYDIDFWHTGFRKYFNNEYDRLYIELYGRVGYFDTDIFGKEDNGVFGVFFGGGLGVGYKFSVCRHWKIIPNIRFGFDYFKFNDYYYTENQNGGVDVTFGNYVDGRNPSKEIQNTDNQIINKNGDVIYLNDKNINKEFFKNSYNLYWFGPTYIGLTIQRNFYIYKNR